MKKPKRNKELDFNLFLKSILWLVLVLVATIYVASAFMISERIAGVIPCKDVHLENFSRQLQDVGNATSKDVSRQLQILEDRLAFVQTNVTVILTNVTGGAAFPEVRNDTRGVDPQPNSAPGQQGKPHSFIGVSPLIRHIVHGFLFCCFLLAPMGIVYVYLWKPIRDLPPVSEQTWKDFNSVKTGKRNSASACIARSILCSAVCSQEERKKLEECLRKSADRKEAILDVLATREKAAKAKALEIAKMAGLTVAISSSAMGDGLAMFFWKSKLVYETFRIYGFRPDTKTAVSIWAHVVFASFFAASIQELSDLFEAPEILGTFPVRVLQGVFGAAVILKGGCLTRAYLTNGIDQKSREKSRVSALEDFKNSAGNQLPDVAKSIAGGFGKITLKVFP